MSSKRRGPGRPPAGDSGEEVRGYAKMTVLMKPATKALLSAWCSLEGVAAWRIIDRALNEQVKKLPAADRRALATLVQRVEARNK